MRLKEFFGGERSKPAASSGSRKEASVESAEASLEDFFSAEQEALRRFVEIFD